ncbi:MAG: hypothetical protein MJZ38_04670 [archaeon]|nr:hypothetical protein [archaeon]
MAAQKKHLRMRGVKQASKRLEDDILGRAKDIADNPGLLRPMCAGNCKKCVFDKVFKDIDKVAEHKNDESVCLKYASKGFFEDMAKAYAGTISLSAAGKVPLLATANVGGEKVPYAVRGSVNAAMLIGCQHYDDPKIRLLYYNPIIRKYKLHLYSFEDGLVCSDDPNMPEDYLYEAWWDTPYKFKEDELECGHKGAVSLNIHIKSLDKTIHICEDCTKDVPTLAFLVSKLCAVDPLDDFEVTVEHKYHSENESGTVRIEGDELKSYMIGRLTDRSLVDKIKRDKLGLLNQSSQMTLIIGDTNHGSNLDGFLAALDGPQSEKDGLRRLLTDRPMPVVLRNGKTSEAISVLWEDHWRDVIGAFTSSDFAETYGEKPKASPSTALEEACKAFISRDVVNSLPVFTKPGYMTRLADSLAKAAKVGGFKMLHETALASTVKDSKSRALVAAFVYTYDESASLHFTLTAEDKSFIEFLKPFVKKVIDADGKTYREEMNTLLMACSSGESV